MELETYLRNRKAITLYSITITCIITSILFKWGILFIHSFRVSQTISVICVIMSYSCMLKIAARLKEKEIHGLQAITWAALMLYIIAGIIDNSSQLWVTVLDSIMVLYCIYVIIDGTIRLLLSVVFSIRKAKSERIIGSIETIVASVTSIAAIVISIVELCI